jgi:hypothetical protein
VLRDPKSSVRESNGVVDRDLHGAMDERWAWLGLRSGLKVIMSQTENCYDEIPP